MGSEMCIRDRFTSCDESEAPSSCLVNVKDHCTRQGPLQDTPTRKNHNSPAELSIPGPSSGVTNENLDVNPDPSLFRPLTPPVAGMNITSTENDSETEVLTLLRDIHQRQISMEKELSEIKQGACLSSDGPHGFSGNSSVNRFLPAENDEDLQELLLQKKQVELKLSTVRRMTLSATVYHMLLALAKPKVWANYSRDGKRGKRNANDIGIVQIITHAVARQLCKSESAVSNKVAHKLSEALKRMPATCRALEKKSSQEATTESVTSDSDTPM